MPTLTGRFSTKEEREGCGGCYTPSVTISTNDLGQPEVLGGEPFDRCIYNCITTLCAH